MKSRSLKIFNKNVFSSYSDHHLFWFRLFGSGLRFKNLITQGLTFSERNGYRKYLKIGNIVITKI